MRYRNLVVGALAGSLTTVASAHAQRRPPDGVSVDPSGVHGFSVALVLGDAQGAATPDNLPVGARKALADMRDFLPYKSYRLLDTQWILCCGSVKTTQPSISGRLRGMEDQQYTFFVDIISVSGPKLSLRFSLRDDPFGKKPVSTKSSGDAALFETVAAKQQERDMLEAMLAERRKQFAPNHPSLRELEGQLEQVKREMEKAQVMAGLTKAAVIDSTFSMDLGETVVIGTSSLKGDKALIALLTAVRRPGSGASTLGEKR